MKRVMREIQEAARAKVLKASSESEINATFDSLALQKIEAPPFHMSWRRPTI
jgi:hypothetical protein